MREGHKQVLRAMKKYVNCPCFSCFQEVQTTAHSQCTTPCGICNKYFGDCDACILSRAIVTYPATPGSKLTSSYGLCEMITRTEGMNPRRSHFNTIIKKEWKTIKSFALMFFVAFLQIMEDGDE